MIRPVLRALLLSAIIASPAASQEVGMSGFSDEGEEMHEFNDQAAACMARSGFGLTSVRAEEAEKGWTEVTGWFGDIFFYSGNVLCDAGRLVMDEVMIIRARSSITDTRPGRAMKADSVTLSGVVKSECGPLSGMGIDARNVRWFSWDGEGNSSDRYYEVVKTGEDAKEQRIRTSAHFKAAEVLWAPTETTPCAVSGRFAGSDMEIRWRGVDRSRIGIKGVSGEMTIHHPKVSLNVKDVRDSALAANLDGVSIFNISDRNVANTDSMHLAAIASAPGSAPLRIVFGKYFRTYALGTAEGLESLINIFPMDLSNALALTDLSIALSSDAFMAEPSVAIPASLGLNLSSAGIARVGGGGKVTASFSGDGKASFGLRAEVSQMLAFDLGIKAYLKRFDKILLESVAAGRTPPDVMPFLDSFTIRAEDRGLDGAIYSVTGRTLRDMLGTSGDAGFSGAAYDWLKGFREGDNMSLTAILTAPVRLGEGLFQGLYSAPGSFQASETPASG